MSFLNFPRNCSHPPPGDDVFRLVSHTLLANQERCPEIKLSSSVNSVLVFYVFGENILSVVYSMK